MYLAKKYLLKIQTQSGVIRTPWQNTKLVVYAVTRSIYVLCNVIDRSICCVSYFIGVLLHHVNLFWFYGNRFIHLSLRSKTVSYACIMASKGSMFGMILVALIVLFVLPLHKATQ